MKEEEKLIRFDWAVKTILRDKANFDVLEGFLSALLRDDITILHLLESESNQEEERRKYNRVDLFVKDSKGRHMIIEVQNEREADYLERILFGTSKVIVENLELGHPFKEIAKVISISILYFNLGKGDDYIYYGTTEFRGVHTHNPLIVKERVKKPENHDKIRYEFREKDVFPEYYLIHVERFEDIIESDIDEWIYMLKHDVIKEEFHSKNIKKAKEKLALLKMDKAERKRYERYLIDLASEIDVIETAKEDGIEIGLERGMEKGMEKGKEVGKDEGIAEVALNMLEAGVDRDTIMKFTGLSKEAIESLK